MPKTRREKDELYIQESYTDQDNPSPQKVEENNKKPPIEKFNNCPKHALKILSKNVNITSQLKNDSIEQQLWLYFQKNTRSSGTKLLMKMIFENPNNFRPQKRAPIIEEMLEKNTLEELTAAQDRLRSIYLREANEIDFEEIVMKKNFKFKNEVLFTITQLLHDLNTGEIKKKIATENRKEYKKRQKKSRSTVKYSDCGYELFKLKVPEIQNDEIFEEESEESDFVCLYLL